MTVYSSSLWIEKQVWTGPATVISHYYILLTLQTMDSKYVFVYFVCVVASNVLWNTLLGLSAAWLYQCCNKSSKISFDFSPSTHDILLLPGLFCISQPCYSYLYIIFLPIWVRPPTPYNFCLCVSILIASTKCCLKKDSQRINLYDFWLAVT